MDIHDQLKDHSSNELLLNQSDKINIVNTSIKTTNYNTNPSKSLNIENQENAKDILQKPLSLSQKLTIKCDQYYFNENSEPNYSILSLLKFTMIFWVYSAPLMLNFAGPSVFIFTSYMYLAWYDDASVTAGFGLSIS